MDLATNRFFSIAELVTLLFQFLDLKGISRLMQTCRNLHDLCTPGLYCNLEIAYDDEKEHNLLASVESIKALARNIQHVRQLSMGPSEIAYYANCIFAYQDKALTRLTDSTEKDHPPQQPCLREEEGQQHQQQQKCQQKQLRPLWLPPPDPRDCTIFPIPPTTLLTKLTFHVGGTWLISDCPYLLSSAVDPKAILAYLCWIMDLNPNLLEVNINKAIIKDQRDIRLLTKSIFGLKKLQSLRLEFRFKYDWEMPPTLSSVLFFSCPASLQYLNLSLIEEVYLWEDSISGEYLNTAGGQLQPWEKDEMESDIPAIITRRQESLLSLESLDISDSRIHGGLSENELVLILEHCPNLTSIAFPQMTDTKVQRLSQRVAELCPKLSSVGTTDVYGYTAQRLAVRMLETLPQQQVNKFICDGTWSFLEGLLGEAGLLFQRHACTLQKILLSDWWNIETKAIQTILTECVALEQLSVFWRDGTTQEQLCIHLEDAIGFPWGCTKIQELLLTVAIPDEPLHHLAEGMVPYYNRSAPITLSTAEIKQFKSLEAFYRQIGVLTHLRSLNLRAIFYDPQGQRPISIKSSNTFPGMLSLGCEETGRPGYLHHLAGLTKLKRLLGSMSSEVIIKDERVRARDIEWMKSHWPMMEEY